MDVDCAKAQEWVAFLQSLNWTLKEKSKSSTSLSGTGVFRGWSAQISFREGALCSIHIWGADRLVISIPSTLSWQALLSSLRICSYCGAEGEVVRLGFAGRACVKCRATHAGRVEFPGWTK